jgi:phosphoribosyl 1,2-cyclic phosphodiesterase
VPVAGSARPALRPSILIRYRGKNVLVDTTPFRQQALRVDLEHLAAVLYTHAHADHVMGLDDIRPFNFRQRGPIPIYGSEETLEAIRRAFPYIFDEKPSESSVPRIVTRVVDGEPFELFGLRFTPVPLWHGRGKVFVRFHSAAYLTDHGDIPDESLTLLEGLELLFLDALRHRPHPTLDGGAVARVGGATEAGAGAVHSYLSTCRTSAYRDGTAAAGATGLRRTESGAGPAGCLLVFGFRTPPSWRLRRSPSAISTACIAAIGKCFAGWSRCRGSAGRIPRC